MKVHSPLVTEMDPCLIICAQKTKALAKTQHIYLQFPEMIDEAIKAKSLYFLMCKIGVDNL